MYRLRDKYVQLSIIALILAIITTFIAIIKSYYLLILFSFLLISISLIAEALFLNIFHRPIESLKQFIRAIIIIILIIFLFIKF